MCISFAHQYMSPCVHTCLVHSDMKVKIIPYDPRKVFQKKYEAVRRRAHRRGANTADRSLYWLLDMIGNPENMPIQYRNLFIRPTPDGKGQEYGPVKLKCTDRYNLAMFCLVNGLDPVWIHDFMESHGAYTGKLERRGEFQSVFNNLKASGNTKSSAFSVADQCYMKLNGEPDHHRNAKTRIQPITHTFPLGKKTHYREHMTAGSAMRSYETPPWIPLKSNWN